MSFESRTRIEEASAPFTLRMAISLRQGWITPEKMRKLAQPMIKNQYGQYLLKLAAEFSGKEK